jgi:5'-methylthioadenosine phosphorylase
VIGVFGGSGLYSLFDEFEERPVDTPYGSPSAAVRIGEIAGVPAAFMPRHGDRHELPPHRVNYRANVWAMREAGVRRLIGPTACGSLKRELPPGTFVVPDQFVDRTRGRADTFYDGPETVHVAGAHPYCPGLRASLVDAAHELDIPVVDGGVVVVVQGPRFSTRAESRWFAASGWDVVNMTQYPEAWLARELEVCYASVALVTDYDAGLEDDPAIEPVSAEAAVEVFGRNLEALRKLLDHVVPRLGPQPDDICANALAGAVIL